MKPIFFAFAALVMASCSADIQVSDFVYWKKADIFAWNLYFPGRALEEERLTSLAAVSAVQSISDGLRASLGKIVEFQTQELATAQMMMQGTSAQGCIQGISQYMNDAIEQEIKDYEDCSADALPNLRRLSNTWTKTNNIYQAAYQNALKGIDNCAKTYPNKNSLNRLIACVETWNNRYFTVANATKQGVYSSPAIGVFTSRVASCAESAAYQVVAKGWNFLSMLAQCAKLSDNVDSQTYAAEGSAGFFNYVTQIDLINQIWNAVYRNMQQVGQIEQEMLRYYDLQKRALEQYVIESRGQGYYAALLYGYLQHYFNTVSATSSDNPASAECASVANTALNSLVNIGSAAALQCDQNIVNNTKLLIAEVNNDFLSINSVLPSVGNAAILSCFNEGYIFAEKTILKCFNLVSSGFNVNVTEVNNNIVKDVQVLLGYESFFRNASLPCGDTILRKAFWGAERALYDLQRCLYIDSGTKYAVTAIPTTTNTFTEAAPVVTRNASALQ